METQEGDSSTSFFKSIYHDWKNGTLPINYTRVENLTFIVILNVIAIILWMTNILIHRGIEFFDQITLGVLIIVAVPFLFTFLSVLTSFLMEKIIDDVKSIIGIDLRKPFGDEAMVDQQGHITHLNNKFLVINRSEFYLSQTSFIKRAKLLHRLLPLVAVIMGFFTILTDFSFLERNVNVPFITEDPIIAASSVLMFIGTSWFLLGWLSGIIVLGSLIIEIWKLNVDDFHLVQSIFDEVDDEEKPEIMNRSFSHLKQNLSSISRYLFWEQIIILLLALFAEIIVIVVTLDIDVNTSTNEFGFNDLNNLSVSLQNLFSVNANLINTGIFFVMLFNIIFFILSQRSLTSVLSKFRKKSIETISEKLISKNSEWQIQNVNDDLTPEVLALEEMHTDLTNLKLQTYSVRQLTSFALLLVGLIPGLFVSILRTIVDVLVFN